MNEPLFLEKSQIKDNTFARQFEFLIEGKLVAVEYALQERKLFLTKITCFEGFDCEETLNAFLKIIMEIAYERKLKVVPTYPKIATFMRKNPTYKDLLPPGIKI